MIHPLLSEFRCFERAKLSSQVWFILLVSTATLCIYINNINVLSLIAILIWSTFLINIKIKLLIIYMLTYLMVIGLQILSLQFPNLQFLTSFAFAYSLKILPVAMALNIFILKVKTNELFKTLQSWHLPIKLIFIIIMTVNFFPFMLKRLKLILIMNKKIYNNRPLLLHPFKTLQTIIVPTIYFSFDYTFNQSKVLLSRGVNTYKYRRTFLNDSKLDLLDYMSIVLIMSLATVFLVFNFLYGD